MNPNPNPNPNRDNPNDLLDTIILLGYNVRIECIRIISNHFNIDHMFHIHYITQILPCS